DEVGCGDSSGVNNRESDVPFDQPSVGDFELLSALWDYAKRLNNCPWRPGEFAARVDESVRQMCDAPRFGQAFDANRRAEDSHFVHCTDLTRMVESLFFSDNRRNAEENSVVGRSPRAAIEIRTANRTDCYRPIDPSST